MILEPDYIQLIREQFRDEVRHALAQGQAIAAVLVARDGKLHAWLTSPAGYDEVQWISSVRTVPLDKNQREEIVVPYYLFRFLCEHLDCFVWEARRPIVIHYEPGAGFKIEAGSNPSVLQLSCRSWESHFRPDEIIRRMDDVRSRGQQSVVLRKEALQGIRSSLGEQKGCTMAGVCHTEPHLVLGDCSPYFVVRLPGGFPSSFWFRFPPHYAWFDHGAIRMTLSGDRVLLETLDGALAALSPIRVSDDPLVRMSFFGQSIGTWTIRHPDSILSIPGDWERFSVLLSADQVFLHPQGKVGIDVTTIGQYEGESCQLALVSNQFLNVIEKGFRILEVRRDSEGNAYLVGRLAIVEGEGRLFSGEKRKHTYDIMALVLPLRAQGRPLQLFPPEVTGTLQ